MEKVNPIAKNEGEAIVVFGERENDHGRFKYNFIESGIKGIKNYQAEGFTDITWVVFTYQYSGLGSFAFLRIRQRHLALALFGKQQSGVH